MSFESPSLRKGHFHEVALGGVEKGGEARNKIFNMKRTWERAETEQGKMGRQLESDIHGTRKGLDAGTRWNAQEN